MAIVPCKVAAVYVRLLIMKTKKQLILPLVVLLLAGACLPANAQNVPLPFDPVGAREIAMAGASTALFGSPGAIYHNPASMVWHTISLGAGIQPYAMDNLVGSWWVHMYNRNTMYNFPLALVMQGWDVPGPRRNAMIGLPIAYGFSPYTPAAVDIKWAFEKNDNGEWVGGELIDIGFLARSPSGPVMGLVLRNLSFSDRDFETMPERYEYGLAWGGGAYTVSASTELEDWDDFSSIKDDWRVGVEIASGGAFVLRGGYLENDDGTWYTGGFALRGVGGSSLSGAANMGMSRSMLAPFQFAYSLAYDEERDVLQHYISYTYFLY